MLLALEIRDMLLIDRLELEFAPGLNVLSGETGAGKSILLDALGFVLGWRGRAELVRPGAETGEVSAVFRLGPGHPARRLLGECGLEPLEDDEIVIRRVNRRDGRKRGWVNGRPVSGEVLRRLSATLVELHGQHDERGLLDARAHRRLLDAFGGPEIAAERERTAAAWQAWQAAEEALEVARRRLDEAQADREFLEHAVDELERLAPEAGEEEALDRRRRLLKEAGALRQELAEVLGALGAEGAGGLLGRALRTLERAAPRLGEAGDEPLATLSRALDAVAEAEMALERLGATVEADPMELERIEDRLFALRDLARKHRVGVDELPALAGDLRARLDGLADGAAQIKALEDERDAARRGWEEAARRLTELRREAARALDAAMAAELPPLRLEAAVFRTAIETGEPGPEGADRVEFRIRTNPGTPEGPLVAVASGGELSRVLLALKVCLRGARGEATMIFDEIDRGVGGATADAVGRRLAALAQGGQLLVVTHSPQVAARAGRHFRVTKEVVGEATFTRVNEVSGPGRVDEIARMLAGEVLTPEARAAAEALIVAGANDR